MNIIKFLTALLMTYWLDVLIVVLFIVALLILLKLGKKDLVKKIVYSLVVKAETALGGGTGQLKYNMVIVQLYNMLPIVIRCLFTQAEIKAYIEDAVNQLDLYLGQGKNLLSASQEATLAALPAEQVVSNAQINNIP